MKFILIGNIEIWTTIDLEENSRKFNEELIKNSTSRIRGLKFLSMRISKPSNSKQTLLLFGKDPGRHFR